MQAGRSSLEREPDAATTASYAQTQGISAWPLSGWCSPGGTEAEALSKRQKREGREGGGVESAAMSLITGRRGIK